MERSRVLVHLLNGISPDPLGDFEAINQEMLLFNPGLRERPQLVVFNKMDLPEARDIWPEIQSTLESRQIPVMAISAVTGENVQQMLYRVQEMLDALPPVEAEPIEELVEIEPPIDEKAFTLRHVEQDLWLVEGVAIERTVQMTSGTTTKRPCAFSVSCGAMGIADALREAGVQEGDRVQIADVELIWGYDNALDD
ncbi:MAG: Obg family GTPase CgtA [Caldilineaceae bacterium]